MYESRLGYQNKESILSEKDWRGTFSSTFQKDPSKRDKQQIRAPLNQCFLGGNGKGSKKMWEGPKKKIWHKNF